MKILITVIFISSLFLSETKAIESKIAYNIENEIITNIDIKNEFKYLLALNDNLRELDKETILNISNNSIIREKIKQIELLKNFEEIIIDRDYMDTYLKNLYLGLNLNSLEEFQLYLKKYDLTLKNVKKKISIELLWNDLIIQKYADQVKIDREKIKKKFQNKNIESVKEYKLSEIVFNIITKNDIEKKYIEIVESINKIGFENSASIFSISDTAKIGGEIGWINENSINTKIRKNINILEIGKISQPIILPNGILILKVLDIKNSEIKIDVEEQYNKAINFEKNRQLNQFSIIYFNKIKKKLGFNG
jgi:peptidyl-prolyl cis-trans isomerase SurA